MAGVAFDPSYKHADIVLSNNNLTATLSGDSADSTAKLVFADTARDWNEGGREWAWDMTLYIPYYAAPIVGYGICKDRSSTTGTLRASGDAIMYYSDGYLWHGPAGGGISRTAWSLDNGAVRPGGIHFHPFTDQCWFINDVYSGGSPAYKVYAAQVLPAYGGPWYPVIEMVNDGTFEDLICHARFTPGSLHNTTYFGTGIGWWYPVPFHMINNRLKRIVTKYVPIRQLRI